ncbi:MAG: 3'-5' exonuclease [Shewanella sp.]
MSSPAANSVIILDFETTGLSPNQGDRAIEIGAVRIQNGAVIDTFQELMNPGFHISGFIEDYTGITNLMLANAAPNKEVMTRFTNFIGNHNLVAHNASFDKRFLDAELDAINLNYGGEFACSMLVARRLYQDAPNHKLGGLVEYKQIENEGVFHRALADSEMTAKLWLQMLNDMLTEHNIIEPSFKLMQILSKKAKSQVKHFLNVVT